MAEPIKIVRVKHIGMGDPEADLYKVESLYNVFAPRIGAYLRLADLNALIAAGVNVEVVGRG